MSVKSLHILANVLTIPQHAPLFGVHQSRQRPQQTRLAGPIPSGDLQALAAVQGEAKSPEHVGFPSPEMQILGLQAALAHGLLGDEQMARESRKYSGLALERESHPVKPVSMGQA